MVIGLNHELLHAGRLCHIQSEDLGRPHEQLVTHVFVAGQTVYKTIEEYKVDASSPSELRQQLLAQHEQVMRALVRGDLDAEFLRLV